MKYYLVELNKRLTERNLDFAFVGNIHDEVQIQVKEEHADEVASIAEACFPIVEMQLGWRCRLDGEAKIGNNWADTH